MKKGKVLQGRKEKTGRHSQFTVEKNKKKKNLSMMRLTPDQ
jgi:hypothetical protein